MLQFFGEQPNWIPPTRSPTGWYRRFTAPLRALDDGFRVRHHLVLRRVLGHPSFLPVGFPWEAWPCFFHGFSMVLSVFWKKFSMEKKKHDHFFLFQTMVFGGMGTENKTRYVETISSWCLTVSGQKTSWLGWLGNTIYIDEYSIHLCLV